MSQEASSSQINFPGFPKHFQNILEYQDEKENSQKLSSNQNQSFPSLLRIMSPLSYSIFPLDFPQELKEKIYLKAQRSAQDFQNFLFEF